MYIFIDKLIINYYISKIFILDLDLKNSIL